MCNRRRRCSAFEAEACGVGEQADELEPGFDVEQQPRGLFGQIPDSTRLRQRTSAVGEQPLDRLLAQLGCVGVKVAGGDDHRLAPRAVKQISSGQSSGNWADLRPERSRTLPNPRTTKSRSGAGFREAAEEIRTLDLLHGKQTL
jgi:hypothetical protein